MVPNKFTFLLSFSKKNAFEVKELLAIGFNQTFKKFEELTQRIQIRSII